jgi:hypothetical protein
LQSEQIGLVHRQNPVKTIEIGVDDRACAQSGEIVSPLGRDPARAHIRRFAGVVMTVRTCRVELQHRRQALRAAPSFASPLPRSANDRCCPCRQRESGMAACHGSCPPAKMQFRAAQVKRRLAIRAAPTAPALRKKLLDKTEAAEVPDPHRIENAVEVVAFVLHHARVETGDAAVDRPAESVETGITQLAPARHPAAQTGTDRQPSQPSSIVGASGVSTGLINTVLGTCSASG